MAGIPLSAFENYTPATDERESFKQYFEQKTANLDSVGKQKALDQIHDYIKSQHGEEQAKYWTEAVKIQKPERTWGQAVSDGLNYLGVMVDSAEQPFADFYDPSSDWATNNRLEKAAHLADLSESQRFDDYKAERNMALAAKQGELAKAGAWLENFIDSPMRQGSELAGSLLPHAALTGVTIASGGTLAPYTVPAMMSVGAAQGIGGARGDLYQATHAMSDADLQAHNEEYRALRQSGISEQVAKDMVGTNIAEHLPELALSGATGAITERFGVVNMLRGKGGALRNIGAEIASEALDEAAQTVLSNSMKQAVNPNQTLYEDVLTNALAGGLMGGVGGVITAPFTQSSQQDANTNSVDSIMEQARNTTTTQLTQSLPTPEYIAIQSALRDGLQNLASKNAMGMESHNQWKRRLETIDEQRETFEQRFQKDYQDGNLNTILNTVDNKKTSEEDKQYHAFVRSVMSKFTPDFEANKLENMDEKVRQQYEQQIQEQAQAEQNRLQSIANLPETQQGQTPSTHAAPATTSQELMDMLIKAGVNPHNENATTEQSTTEPSALQQAAIASNESGGLAMSALEQAKADATRLPPLSNFTFNETGSLNNGANRNAISQWVDKFPQSQQAALQDADGRLSQQGLARLQNAMLYQAYGDTPTLARMIESTSNESRNISNALAQAAGSVADAKDTLQQYGTLNDLDISNDLTAAAELIEQLRADGLSVTDWLAQQELIPDIAATPSAQALVEYFDANIRSSKAIRELINEYYRLATDYNPNQEDMFGDTIAPSKEQLLQQALNQHGQTTNFNTNNQPATSRTEPKQQESSPDSPDLQPTKQPRNGETNATSTRQPNQTTQSQSTRNGIRAKINEYQSAINQALGKHAHAVKVVSRDELVRPENAENLDGVEGFYNPADGSITLIAESLKDAQHAQFVAWHELAHRKIDVSGAADWNNEIEKAGRHETVRKLADKIQAQRKNTDDPAATNRAIANEEAIAELYAAHETGDYKALEQKYGIKIPRVLQRNLGGFLSRLGNKLASIWRKITGKRETNSADVYRLLQTLSRANDTNKRATRSGSLKRSSNADRATYDRAFENGETELTFTQWQQVRTPEFKAWFGDWENDPENASKVINQKTGEPLVVYHGTKSDDGFSVFWTHEYGAPIGAFFTSNINVARTYAEQKEINALYKKYPERFAEKIKELEAYNDAHIYSVFLNIRNPYSLDAKGKNYTQLGEDGNKYTDQFIPLKYKTNDGIIFKNIYDIGAKRNQLGSSNGLSDVFIAFEPNQIKSATNNVGAFDPSNDDIRYSRRTTQNDIAQIAKTGKIDYDKSLFQSIMDNDIGSYINQNRNAHRNIADWLIEGFADNLHPVAKWIDKLPIKEQQRELLKQAMYRAGGKRDYANEQITRQYIQPLNQELARVAEKYGRSAIEVKRLVGYWLSAKYAPTANARLLKRAADELAAAQQSNDAQAIAQAQQAYNERKAAIDGVAQGKVAGGYSNPFAAQVKADLEQHISPADMQAVGQHIYAMLQHKLDLDLNSGRISQQMYQEFKANPDYVPLTGDPMSELQDDNDIISHGGGMNQSRDKQMQGATSIAEDGIDAAMKAVSKTTAIHGWSDFKSQLNKVYESAIADQKAQGKTPQQAEQYVIQQYGMTRRALQGVTRPSDNRIIYQSNGQYYEFELNNELVEALQRHNTEQTNSFLNLIAIPNRWAARAVTQFTPSFAPVNAIRDIWEKSEMIRTFKAWDANGNPVDMDKVARSAIGKFITGKGIKQTFNMAWRNDFSTPQGQELKRFLELGGVSTQGMMLAPTESDLIKQIKKETGFGKVLNQALHVVENYNKTLDLMPSFAMYQALREQGVSDVEAAGLVLDTTNFRKTGKYMSGIKAIYMFAQPIATGAYNLARFLNTKKGKQRAMLYFAAGVALYSILRELDDEDESGNKMDAMGDITRFIPIPLGNGKYLKIPVGFGLPQMMWNMATNSVKAFHSDITPTEALSNMASHWTKTIAPVSPSEIPVSQYPAAKAALTLTPSFLQPMVQQALNRNAFGTQITLGYTSSKKLKAEQSKATTAQEWQNLALFMQRKTSVDMHPEQWKNLIMGYGSMLFGGLFRDAINMTIENPNAEELGKTGKTPFINALYGAGNEFAIQSRYYEAYDEARSISQEYESRKREGDLGDWLTEERKKKLDWFRRATSSEQRVSKRKSRATRAHNKGVMNDERYRQAELNAVSQRLEYQKPLLKQWRRLENLNTID